MSTAPSSPLAATQLGFVEIPDRFRYWEGGSAKDLADAVVEALEEIGAPDAEINERLVRYYTTAGVVDTPRASRRGGYGVRHLAQMIVARKLVGERLSLSQIRDFKATIPWEQLEKQASSAPEVFAAEAQRLVAQFKGQSPLQHVLANKLRQRAAQRVGIEDPRAVIRWKLAPWCEVLADPAAVESLTDEQIEAMGMDLASALKRFRDQR